MEYTVGTKFQTRGKHPKECVITDILKTYNLLGELVEIRYVARHVFMGQTIIDRNVCATTIAMGLIH
jgi:hypothetical protein